MHINKRQSTLLGVSLIVVGLVWWLHLGWLILPGILAVGGFMAYQQRRQMGRVAEAVQIGLWGVGLALLFLLHFSLAGILLLAGASVLLRGREDRADAYIQNAIAQFGRRSGRTARPIPTQHVPIATQQPPSTPLTPINPRPSNAETPAVGETTRLRD